jgi:hypothetical protein
MVRTLSIAVLAAAVPLSGLGAQWVHGQENLRPLVSRTAPQSLCRPSGLTLEETNAL